MPLFHGRKETNPGFMELQEDLVTHFARKGLIGFMLLDQMEDSYVVQIQASEDEGLAHEVIGRIPQVLARKSSGVDALVRGSAY